MDIRYQITGGVPLQGEVTIGGSKNAALPMIAASALVSGVTVLHNVPRLRDTELMLQILEFLGATTSFQNGTVRIDTTNLQNKPIPEELVSKLRGSIVLLGPLLVRFGVVEMSYPGGCVLGKRPVEAHVLALEQMGAANMSTPEVLHLQGQPKPTHVILPEFSVTATENALLAAAATPGETRIDIAAAEPHVQEVARMVQAMGAEVEGIGTHTVIVRGTKNLRATEHRVPFDYLEAGCMVIAALVTHGKLRLKDIDIEHLYSFLDTIRRAGGVWKYDKDAKTLLVDGELSFLNATKMQTMIFPGFPTDLQAPMGVLMTQAKGVSRIFETLFEGRLAYLYELEKMGAHIEILNAHQALIIGPTPLKGRLVASNDIRAGAAMVLAGLTAEGKTTITDVRYIERGHEKFDEKLRSVGAKIERIVIDDEKR
ncbi:MAG TPA: UDP-N-acetylglucosamine 1-carboxyvinyltransferase [Candidatus Peribacteraceae bacterium]|nr:UDP-N-acetylglucosamine 1-carboxyvinyltransferase [Candidatus Peribacteraceae bacterium]